MGGGGGAVAWGDKDLTCQSDPACFSWTLCLFTIGSLNIGK